MVIKAWGPLFALLALFGASLFGLLVEHSEPHNRSQPAIAPHRNRPESKRISADTSNENNDKGKQQSNWYDKPTDWLLALFTGFLALYTWRLSLATAGLFRETAELRGIANEQRTDMLRSIVATEKAANTALRQINAMIAVESPDPVILRLELVEYIDIDDENYTAITEIINSGVPSDLCQISVCIQNKGRTNATIIRFCIETLVSPTLPTTPIYEHIQADWNFKIGNETSCVNRISTIRLTKEERTVIENKKSYLWIFGFFTYSNFMRETFDVGFLFRWDMWQGFVREPNHHYEYHRQR